MCRDIKRGMTCQEPKQDGIAGTTCPFCNAQVCRGGEPIVGGPRVIPNERETHASTGGSLKVCCLRRPLYGPWDPIQFMEQGRMIQVWRSAGCLGGSQFTCAPATAHVFLRQNLDMQWNRQELVRPGCAVRAHPRDLGSHEERGHRCRIIRGYQKSISGLGFGRKWDRPLEELLSICGRHGRKGGLQFPLPPTNQLS